MSEPSRDDLVWLLWAVERAGNKMYDDPGDFPQKDWDALERWTAGLGVALAEADSAG